MAPGVALALPSWSLTRTLTAHVPDTPVYLTPPPPPGVRATVDAAKFCTCSSASGATKAVAGVTVGTVIVSNDTIAATVAFVIHVLSPPLRCLLLRSTIDKTTCCFDIFVPYLVVTK